MPEENTTIVSQEPQELPKTNKKRKHDTTTIAHLCKYCKKNECTYTKRGKLLKYCADCQNKSKIDNKLRREKLMKLKLCIQCATNSVETHLVCAKCRERSRNYRKNRKTNHLCVDCGKPTEVNEDVSGTTQHSDTTSFTSLRAANITDNNNSSGSSKKYYTVCLDCRTRATNHGKMRIEQLKQAKLCAQCGKKSVENQTTVTCDDCRTKIKQRRLDRKAKHLCITCNKETELKPNGKHYYILCQSCRNKTKSNVHIN